MKKIFQKRKKSRGVALLFALGILSLLLILGLAFVSNSLLAQKAAVNNSNRALAKMLAQSAISRAATAIMIYQHAIFQMSGTDLPSEFTSTCSYIPDSETYDFKNQDQLQFDKKSLTNQYSKLSYLGNSLGYQAANSEARWELIYEDSKSNNSDRKIIGRIAYQVLPPMSNSRLNLSHMLKGVAERTALDPQKPLRLGQDTNELNIEYTRVFTESGATAPTLKDLLDVNSLPEYYDDLYTAYRNNFFDTDVDEKKEWIERWFGEGTKAAEYEAYLYEDGSKTNYAYRFNLGDKVAWDSHFSDTAKADAETLIEELSGDSIEFREMATNLPTRYGIPFLRRLGSNSDRHSFPDLKTLRKQIIANLNDYCDSDSIPTSDVSPANWKTAISQSSSSWPTYTGNEKTWYINEVALGLDVAPEVSVSVSGTTPKATVKLEIEPSYIAELIDIYNITEAHDYKFETLLRQRDATIEVSVNGELTYQLPGDPGTKKVSITNKSKTVQAAMDIAASQSVEIDFTNSITNNSGYKANSVKLPKLKINELDFSNEFTIPAADAGNSPTNVKAKITTIRFEIKSLKFKLAPMVLYTTGNATGVDFVRFPDDELPTNANVNSDLTCKRYDDTDAAQRSNVGGSLQNTHGLVTVQEGVNQVPDITPGSSYLLVGGLQVRDPRQNLNVKIDADPNSNEDAPKSDWKINLDLIDYLKHKDSPSTNKITMDFTVTGAPGTQVLAIKGARNTCSNPSKPEGYMNGSTIVDYIDEESVEDPANSGSGISTAVIANHPMRSLWELGAIHRGAAWQTINLKKAGSPSDNSVRVKLSDHTLKASTNWDDSGTSYITGDGGILDQVTISPDNKARNYGKLDVNMLWVDDPQREDNAAKDILNYDRDMVGALFINLRYNQSLADFNGTSKPAEGSGTPIDKNNGNWSTAIQRLMAADSKRPFKSRAQFIDWESSGDHLGNAFGLIDNTALKTDASQEEIIGKTINLLTASNGALPNVVQVLIVAQTIRDIEGPNLVKLRHDGKPTNPLTCQLGTFDLVKDASSNIPESIAPYVYFDEITGECKILVTLDRDPVNGQMMVRKIEYID